MAKTIRHMGMLITEEEHEHWHRENKKMSPAMHKRLMKKKGRGARYFCTAQGKKALKRFGIVV